MTSLIYADGSSDRWTVQSIGSGSVGITISNPSWRELQIVAKFGANPEVTFSIKVIREEIDNASNQGYMNKIVGASRTNDSHFVIFHVSYTNVTLESWTWRDTEYASSSPLYVYSR